MMGLETMQVDSADGSDAPVDNWHYGESVLPLCNVHYINMYLQSLHQSTVCT